MSKLENAVSDEEVIEFINRELNKEGCFNLVFAPSNKDRVYVSWKVDGHIFAEVFVPECRKAIVSLRRKPLNEEIEIID